MDWWREMFSSPGWRAVQLSWEDADDADEDAEQVIRALDLAPGARVLDSPCGTGRIAKRLIERGYPTVGIDVTDEFLRVARAARVPVVRGDMRTRLIRPAAVDAVVCLWGSFGYFDEDGNRAQAAAAAQALAPGGRYLIDTVVADSVLTDFEPQAAWAVGSTEVRERRRYDEEARRIEDTWTFTRGSASETQTTSVRMYTVVELMELLSEVGFASFHALDDTLQPFQSAADRLWLVASMPD